MTQKYNKQPIATILSDFGKVPPQACELEEVVLGSLLVEREAITTIIDFITSESFYKESHQKIFSAILEMYKRTMVIDLYTVTEELRSRGDIDSVGGPIYLTMLTSKIVSAANIEYHARIIAQKYMQRELIRISTELQTRAFDDTYDVSELLDYGETNLMEISGKLSKKKAVKLGIIVNGIIDEIDKIQNGEIKLIGVPTGFTIIDRMTGGLKKQEDIIIAGRPSTGKTAFACQIAKNAAGLGYPVAIFSCEMSKEELGRRYLSGATGRSNIELLNGKCDIEQIIKDSYSITTLPIYIDDTSSISVIELRAKVRRMIIEYGIKLFIVDYLQLMTGEGKGREEQVSFISRGVKAIAKDLEIPVIALSQLNRECEARTDKKPMLSDLRESGALEQDADIVIGTYTPAKYGIHDYNGKNTEGLFIPLILKNRNGPLGEIELRHNKSFSVIMQEDEIDSFPIKETISANRSFDEPTF